MKSYKAKSGLGLASAVVLALSILAGCGGGSSSSPGTPISDAKPTAISGTVAVGGAVASAKVTVIGANGATVGATADLSGNYTAPLSGLTAPFVIVASDSSGVTPTLVSVVAALPTGTTAPVVANITTLTTAVAAMLTSSGNPLDLTTSGNAASLVTSSSVAAAVTKLNTALATILAANGLSTSSFDPIGVAFSTDQTGADAVIDAVQLVSSPSGGMQLVSSADTNSGIPCNSSTSVASPLSAPPASADYLSTLVTQVNQCLAGTAASCAQAIASNYLENGFSSFTTAHSALAASGVTLGTPQTLQFFTSGSTQKARVLLRYSTASGTSGAVTTVVQKASDGTWSIVGNQQPYDATITSFVIRRQFLDSTNAAFGRYEAGIEIDIPAGASGTPNPVNLAVATVSGPGINGTAYLLPRNATGNALLALSSTARTQVPTGGVTTNSNTTLYRWSWQALSGASTFTPGNGSLGFYTPSPINVTSVPQFATYTVTFYDSTGAQIGQPYSVTNASPTVFASAGASVVWQTLSSSIISDFLNPSGTLAGAQSSVALSWSNTSANAPLAPLVRKAQIQAVPGTGVTPSTAVDGWWTGPAAFSSDGQYSQTVTAGVDQTGTQQCTPSCAFPALQAGGSRNVQLLWTAGQIKYYNFWKYSG